MFKQPNANVIAKIYSQYTKRPTHYMRASRARNNIKSRVFIS